MSVRIQFGTSQRLAQQNNTNHISFSVGYLFTRGSYGPNSHVLNGFPANAFRYSLQKSTDITFVPKFNGIILDDCG